MSLDGGAGADDDARRGLLLVSLDGMDLDMLRMPLRGSVVDVDTLDPDVGSHVGHTHHDVGHAKPAFPDPPPPVSLPSVPKPPKHPPCCSAPLRQGLVPGDSVNDWEYESQSYDVKKITTFVSKSKRLRKTVTETTITVVEPLGADEFPAGCEHDDGGGARGGR